MLETERPGFWPCCLCCLIDCFRWRGLSGRAAVSLPPAWVCSYTGDAELGGRVSRPYPAAVGSSEVDPGACPETGPVASCAERIGRVSAITLRSLIAGAAVRCPVTITWRSFIVGPAAGWTLAAVGRSLIVGAVCCRYPSTGRSLIVGISVCCPAAITGRSFIVGPAVGCSPAAAWRSFIVDALCCLYHRVRASGAMPYSPKPG